MANVVELPVIHVSVLTTFIFDMYISYIACYGIISIPDGKWYCRRCEVGEMQAV